MVSKLRDLSRVNSPAYPGLKAEREQAKRRKAKEKEKKERLKTEAERKVRPVQASDVSRAHPPNATGLFCGCR